MFGISKKAITILFGLLALAFAVGGALLGFTYYKLVGCRTGACPITSSPVVSTLYGAFLGYLISGGG